MIDRLLLRHPRSIGESYGEHFGTAFGFGVRMIVGGAACIVHAIVPALFERKASDTVKGLYATMKSRQPAYSKNPPAFTEPQWQLEYEI